jgi:choline/glycine/proline betaine transport protein
MVVVFFVTSADSGALVLNMLSAHGRDDTPILQRVIWAAVIGAIAAVLLLSGGLASLQTAAIASALPFSLALLGAIWGFSRALSVDAGQRDAQSVTPVIDSAGDWRERLANLLSFPEDRNVRRFLRDEVSPALRDFAAELSAHEIEAQVNERFDERSRVRLEVLSGGEIDFVYEVRCRAHAMPDERLAGEAIASLAEGDRYFRAEVHLSQGGQDYCIMGWTRDQITHDVLNHYENHLQFLHSMR